VLLDDADLVLMDEPFSQLDALTRIEANTFARFCLQGKTILLVTHDPMEALRLSDQILILNGKPASIKDQLFLTETDRHRPELIHELYKKLGVRL
ncbi:MAG: ABC transporter ATP-binding protein, partial [Alphaproteobacteria bacterium]|nr:ABC transporter ATP-binding protein [Alphaproteobacteria bacterium]